MGKKRNTEAILFGLWTIKMEVGIVEFVEKILIINANALH